MYLTNDRRDKTMEQLTLYRPGLDDLAWREKWLSDPETMSYNHAYGGTVPLPRERWADWYARWVEDGETHFYRYLRLGENGAFVGNIAYYYDEEFDGHLCEVLIAAPYRGRGFGRQGLALLCRAAGANGVKRLMDDIAVDNPSVEMFLRGGFRERTRTDAFILVEKEL